MSGVNDNNFGRRNVPSNQYPPIGYNGNPFGNFAPDTTNFQHMMAGAPGMAVFPEAYRPPREIISRIDYRNPGNTLHNNIGDVVLDEHIVEYGVEIDSSDRNGRSYPDPFHYIVRCSAPNSGRVAYVERGVFKEEIMATAGGPFIDKNFRNVKYVKLDSIVLPRYPRIIQEDGNYVFDTTRDLYGERFVLLEIAELEELDKGKTFYGTNDVLSKKFAIVYPDKKIGDNLYLGTPYHGNKIFKNSQLGNVDKFTIQFYDSQYQPLKYNITDPAVPINDIRNPMNQYRQNFVSLIVGVVESQINNETQFAR